MNEQGLSRGQTVKGMRPLLLLAKAPKREGRSLDDPVIEYEALAEAIDAEILDFHSVAAGGFAVRTVGKYLGDVNGLALLGLLRGRHSPYMYVTADHIGMRSALINKVLRRHGRVVAVFHQVDTPSRRKVMKLLGPKPFGFVISLASSQTPALRDVGFGPSKTVVMKNWIDTDYFSPQPIDEARALLPEGLEWDNYALSVGMESRDYPTLQSAMAQLPSRHLHIVGSGWSEGSGYGAASGVQASSNVSNGSGYSMAELRALYQGARMVILPVQDVTYAAGVTGSLEAMSMAKFLVSTSSRGMADYLRDGACGAAVPCGEVAAMREAIEGAWDSPRLADVGAANRQWAIDECRTSVYVERMKARLEKL